MLASIVVSSIGILLQCGRFGPATMCTRASLRLLPDPPAVDDLKRLQTLTLEREAFAALEGGACLSNVRRRHAGGADRWVPSPCRIGGLQ